MTTESIILNAGDHEFNYDPKSTYLENFNKWRVANLEERSAWNEKPMTMEEAESLFDKMYGKRK